MLTIGRDRVAVQCRFQHPWGMNHGAIKDEELFKQLREWTLAQVCLCSNPPEINTLTHAGPAIFPCSCADGRQGVVICSIQQQHVLMRQGATAHS